MQQVLDVVNEFVVSRGPTILAAVGILIVGWLVAVLISLAIRAALRRTKLDNRIATWLVGEERAEGLEIEKWISRGFFFLAMLFVLVAFFETLGLTLITEPLNRFLIQIFDYLPNLIGPAILVLVAWVVASGLRFVVRRSLAATKLDDKLSDEVGLEEGETVPLSQTLGDAGYWLVFLLFLPAVLGALNIEGLLEPVQSMIDKILAFLPNLFAAGLILAVGWLLARIVQRIVSNLMAAAGADRLSQNVGLAAALGEQKLSGLTGLILYILILIPVLVASLNALKLDAITRPASDMLNTFLTALPRVFAASLVLLIAFLVGRVVSGLVATLLAGVGFDGLLARIGLAAEPDSSPHRPSDVAGNLVMVAIMLFASIEAVNLLGFDVLGGIIAEFMVFAGHVLLGLIIFGVGLFLANLAGRTVEASKAAQAALLALTARVSIMVLAGAMALRQMGLANEIITLAFGLLLGAVCVAAAVAFGLAGRELAAETLDNLKAWSRDVKVKPTATEKLELDT